MKQSSTIDRGLSIAHREAAPGVPMTCAEIAAKVGCTKRAIQDIEAKAMATLRRRYTFSQLLP